VVRYLHAKTRKELVGKCENVLLRVHAPRMWNAFQVSPLSYHSLYIPRAYTAPGPARLRRRRGPAAHVRAAREGIPEGLEPLRKKFEAHIKAAGLGAVSTLVGTQGAAGTATDADTKSTELDPKVYINVLLAVHEKNTATHRVSRPRWASGRAG
jgi:cullin 1